MPHEKICPYTAGIVEYHKVRGESAILDGICKYDPLVDTAVVQMIKLAFSKGDPSHPSNIERSRTSRRLNLPSVRRLGCRRCCVARAGVGGRGRRRVAGRCVRRGTGRTTRIRSMRCDDVHGASRGADEATLVGRGIYNCMRTDLRRIDLNLIRCGGRSPVDGCRNAEVGVTDRPRDGRAEIVVGRADVNSRGVVAAHLNGSAPPSSKRTFDAVARR